METRARLRNDQVTRTSHMCIYQRAKTIVSARPARTFFSLIHQYYRRSPRVARHPSLASARVSFSVVCYDEIGDYS